MPDEIYVTRLAEEITRRFREAKDFRQSLADESERGCALLAASYLDGQLLLLLTDRLVNDPAVVEDILRPDGPLGSFSSRIDMAYLLGLIGATPRRDLHLIRRIRNDMGHSAKRVSFEDQSTAERCSQMRLTNMRSTGSPRQRFLNAVMGVSTALHTAGVRSDRLAAAPDKVPDEETKAASRDFAERLVRELFGRDED